MCYGPCHTTCANAGFADARFPAHTGATASVANAESTTHTDCVQIIYYTVYGSGMGTKPKHTNKHRTHFVYVVLLFLCGNVLRQAASSLAACTQANVDACVVFARATSTTFPVSSVRNKQEKTFKIKNFHRFISFGDCVSHGICIYPNAHHLPREWSGGIATLAHNQSIWPHRRMVECLRVRVCMCLQGRVWNSQTGSPCT